MERRQSSLPRLLPVLLWSCWFGKNPEAATSSSESCIPLAGVESGGGEGTLDFDIISTMLGTKDIFDLSIPILPTVAACSSDLETPISMRHLLAIDTAALSVTNMFRPGGVALDIFGDKTTSDARRRCQPEEGEDSTLFDLHLNVAVAYTLVYGALQGMPYCSDQVDPVMTDTGLPLAILEGEPSIDTPWGLAKAYVDEINAYMNDNDGWNADGSLSRDYNRVAFEDFSATDSAGNSWTPYVPQNRAYQFLNKERWQPLRETDSLGYISTQEHVTPHIGVTARFYGFYTPEDEEAFASRELGAPDYQYPTQALKVLRESRDVAADEEKQKYVSLFDNKFTSLVPLKSTYFMRPSTTQTTLDFYRLTTEVQLAIYNGVVLSWREKIRHDLPRPPTIVKDALGDKLFYAYAGADEGVQRIKASEWEPFIRTMPHSEFPSASACLCQAYAEQIVHSVGDDEIDPPLEFEGLEFSSWSNISTICGDSRAWGGMHFEAAVPAGTELCGGGQMAESISASVGGLIDGDEAAAIFNKDVGELLLRPL